ncbi:CHAD domain-containing protein [Haloferula sp. A504]|uniref:CHAD domain-containing protein n=1 Tax=Haloferula sp. A504 TaxID=3373601 RepID=UPI0031BFAC8B|nr:CHAD domain-containing protein [Verrucomicrobiaceae bacterium E54]
MSFRIHPERSTKAQVRRVALEQLDRAASELAARDRDLHESIHQVRKRCKKLRALLRLCRGVIGKRYQRENARYRDAARRLSGLRDAEALTETYDRLLDRYDGPLDRAKFAPIRRRFTLDKQRRARERTNLGEEMDAFAAALGKGRVAVDRWAGKVKGWDDLLPGIAKTYRRGRKAMRAAAGKPSTECFHEWRKRTKYFAHQLKLLEDLWRPVLQAQRKEAKRLADLLGREHDLGVMETCLATDFADYGSPDVLRVLNGLIHEQREALRREAFDLGARIFAEKPSALVLRLEAFSRARRAAQSARTDGFKREPRHS